MYNEIIRGIFPLLIFPDESIKYDDKIMSPIKFHPIWFLSSRGEKASEEINLIYKEKVYFAKRYQFYSEIEQPRDNYKDEMFSYVAIIVVLPKEMNVYNRIFIKIVLETIIKELKVYIYKIIKSEILKEDLIKDPKNEEIIKEGEVSKKKVKDFFNFLFKKQIQIANTI